MCIAKQLNSKPSDLHDKIMQHCTQDTCRHVWVEHSISMSKSDQDVIIEESINTGCSSCSSSVKIISIVIAFLLKLRVVYNISDRAVILLLRFFKFILLLVGNTFGVPDLKEGIYFPQSLHGCYSYLDLPAKYYKEYIVCPTCHFLYDSSVQNLIVGTAQRQVSEKCSFVEFPNHPQERFRLPCNTILLSIDASLCHRSQTPPTPHPPIPSLSHRTIMCT